MAAFLPVDKFFKHVYLVDLSPSLCEVARDRFERLGWKNVTVLCQDARSFTLPEKTDPRSTSVATDGVDLVTMSYSLSMIPGEHNSRIYPNDDADLSRLLQCGGLSDLASEVNWTSGRV